MIKALIVITIVLVQSGTIIGSESQGLRDLSTEKVTTSAYELLVFRKVAVEAELAEMSETLSSKHPSIARKRFELRVIMSELEKLLAVKAFCAGGLSVNFARLILHKVAVQVELENLRQKLTSQHPEIKKKQFELAALVREIHRVSQ